MHRCTRLTVVQVPQLYLNYKTGSAEGISLAFLGVWLIGDITNLSGMLRLHLQVLGVDVDVVHSLLSLSFHHPSPPQIPSSGHVHALIISTGALWADLVPTVIALAIYFCIADVVLIAQCLYYNHVNAKTARQQSVASAASEDEPLLTRRRSSDTIGLPGSHRRRSSAVSAGRNSLTKILEEEEIDGKPWLKNTLSILGVIVVGTAGWAIAWQSGVWVPQPEDGDVVGPQATAVGAKVLGYISAVCYLGCVPSFCLQSSHLS